MSDEEDSAPDYMGVSFTRTTEKRYWLVVRDEDGEERPATRYDLQDALSQMGPEPRVGEGVR